MTPLTATEPTPKRTVYAPQTAVAPGAALSVDVADDEDVQWQWSHGTDGQSRITGYQIVKKISNRAGEK